MIKHHATQTCGEVEALGVRINKATRWLEWGPEPAWQDGESNSHNPIGQPVS